MTKYWNCKSCLWNIFEKCGARCEIRADPIECLWIVDTKSNTTLFVCRDNTCLLQCDDMLHRRRQRNTERFGQVRNRHRSTLPKSADHGSANRQCQRIEKELWVRYSRIGRAPFLASRFELPLFTPFLTCAHSLDSCLVPILSHTTKYWNSNRMCQSVDVDSQTLPGTDSPKIGSGS